MTYLESRILQLSQTLNSSTTAHRTVNLVDVLPISLRCKTRGESTLYSISRWTKSGSQRLPLTWVKSTHAMVIEERLIERQSVQVTPTIPSARSLRVVPFRTFFSILKARPGLRKAFSRSKPPPASASPSRSRSSLRVRTQRSYMPTNSFNINERLSSRRHTLKSSTRE